MFLNKILKTQSAVVGRSIFKKKLKNVWRTRSRKDLKISIPIQKKKRSILEKYLFSCPDGDSFLE